MWETITDPYVVYETTTHGDKCACIVMNGHSFLTATPAAEIKAEIDRLRAEAESEFQTAAYWKKLQAEHARFREALEIIAQGTTARPFAVAREALNQPDSEVPDPKEDTITLNRGRWVEMCNASERHQAALRKIATRMDGREYLQQYANEALDPPKPTTWASEHYPVDASKLKGASDEACTKHGLDKWNGALPENLAPYEMKYEDWVVYGGVGGVLELRERTCALCVNHAGLVDGVACPQCPVVKSGQLACDRGDSAWKHSRDDPRPMIACLEKTLAWIREQKKPEPTQLERLREKVETQRARWLSQSPTVRCSGYVAYYNTLRDLNDIAKQSPPEPGPTAMDKLRRGVEGLKQIASTDPTVHGEDRVTAYGHVLDLFAKETPGGK